MSKLIPLFISATGLNEFDIRRIIGTAPSRYKTYPIEKRRGGFRLISQPARELKALQRVLTKEVLCQLPIHNSATAYRGWSIRQNAAAHVKNGPILKYDFEEFFPSIRDRDWRKYCQERAVFEDPEDVDISARLLFFRRRGTGILQLAIGAPSSPALSNILMRDFDERLSTEVAKDSVTYTRYADDLTFSAKRTGFLNGVDKTLRRIIRDMQSPKLKINEAKTVTATKKYKRFVTGLVLSNDGKVSIGHDRKRLISATVHRAKQGKLNARELAHLSGMLAFIHDVEPDFLERLKIKYGGDIIGIIKATPKPSIFDGEIPF